MTGWDEVGLGAGATTARGTPIDAAEFDDYPTAVRADYIFACEDQQGHRRALGSAPARSTSSRKSCRTIATSPETFLSHRKCGPVRHHVQSPRGTTATNDLRRAQAKPGALFLTVGAARTVIEHQLGVSRSFLLVIRGHPDRRCGQRKTSWSGQLRALRVGNTKSLEQRRGVNADKPAKVVIE